MLDDHLSTTQTTPLSILMVASEVVPFAKTGGLADVVGVLPRHLEALGHDVRVVMPRYREVDRERYGLRRVDGPLGVPMGVLGTQWGGVLEGRLPRSDVRVYFIEHDGYFDRPHLYNESSGEGYLDNDRRFVFLARAALELCSMIGFAPDVVHANDWHTAAAPIFLNTLYRHHTFLGGAASVLTIHNMEYQGRFYAGLMDVLGIGWEHFHHLNLEWNDQVNLLKGGLYNATLINAVSPGYALEIRTPKFGHGLDGVVVNRSRDVRGILNGIDYEVWNPETDPHLAATYSAADLSGKLICKRALQREMGLPERDVPVFGMVTRLVHQKGIDVLAEAMPRILDLDIQLVLLGSGAAWAQDYFTRLAAQHPKRFACTIGYDDPLAHRIEAGADFFVMPSRFEPCGLNQLYSLRYGTLPLVHAVGGLADTVQGFDEHTVAGTGFTFDDLNANALFDTIGWATWTWYHRPEAMRVMRRRAMEQRFSWERAAKEYEALYREAVWRVGR